MLFSLISTVLVLLPASPVGPVITGAVSSISATVTVTVWSVDVVPSDAFTTTTYELAVVPD